MTDPNQSNQLPDDDAPIEAAAFVPLDPSRKRLAIKASPAKLAVGLAAVCFIAAAWFVLTAHSISFDITPAESDTSIEGAFSVKIGPRYLIRAGNITVRVHADGYQNYSGPLTVGDDQSQNFAIELVPLPGLLSVDSGAVSGADVVIDGNKVGVTPLQNIELDAGEHKLLLKKDRYEESDNTLMIVGKRQQQNLSLTLLPAWAQVEFTTTPAGATVTIDGKDTGMTPLTTEVLEGIHEVVVKLPAHKAWTDNLAVTARKNMVLPPITLEPADGLVLLRSTPSGANVTVDGTFRGQTPVELSLKPQVAHEAVFFRNGYQESKRQLRTSAAEESTVSVTLQPITSTVQISATPADAELFINGELRGSANQKLALLAANQTIEIRKPGYVTYSTNFISRPGLEQQLVVKLLTVEQQRSQSIKPEITTINGQKLKLIHPGTITLGASRREPGRQANEVLRNVNLTRPYYMSLTEVTNGQYAAFDAEHSSGMVDGHTLGTPLQPVVRVTWEQAALYCNWLSSKEGLPAFYVTDGKTITGVNASATGYRLPTEAEWDWVARVNGDPASLLRFPWGAELPPPDNQGNYADISAGNFLGRILPNYNDGFAVSAPVASFPPNANGFYDIGGNAAEWVHDYYGTVGTAGNEIQTDPLGPVTGTYHVIKGSSWAHGTVTELRLSFRDYNNASRDDVGFRIARYLGE